MDLKNFKFKVGDVIKGGSDKDYIIDLVEKVHTTGSMPSYDVKLLYATKPAYYNVVPRTTLDKHYTETEYVLLGSNSLWKILYA